MSSRCLQIQSAARRFRLTPADWYVKRVRGRRLIIIHEWQRTVFTAIKLNRDGLLMAQFSSGFEYGVYARDVRVGIRVRYAPNGIPIIISAANERYNEYISRRVDGSTVVHRRDDCLSVYSYYHPKNCTRTGYKIDREFWRNVIRITLRNRTTNESVGL